MKISFVEIILKIFNCLSNNNIIKIIEIVNISKIKDFRNKTSKKLNILIQNKAIKSIVLIVKKKIYIIVNFKKFFFFSLINFI